MDTRMLFGVMIVMPPDRLAVHLENSLLNKVICSKSNPVKAKPSPYDRLSSVPSYFYLYLSCAFSWLALMTATLTPEILSNLNHYSCPLVFNNIILVFVKSNILYLKHNRCARILSCSPMPDWFWVMYTGLVSVLISRWYHLMCVVLTLLLSHQVHVTG